MQFSTRAGATSSTENTVQVGPGTYASGVGTQRFTDALPSGAAAGFQVVALDSASLKLVFHQALPTNTGTRAGDLTAQQHLAAVMQGLTAGRELLVIVQSIGDPGGEARTPAWAQIADQIAKLGGTASVFNALKGGGYALVGRVGMTAPPAEVSQPLTGQQPKLEGDLARAQSSDFEPLVASPVNGAGDDMLKIVYQKPIAFPAFSEAKAGEPSERNAETYIGIHIMKVCEAATCDVRVQYYKKYNTASWGAIQGDLQRVNCAKESSHSGDLPFTVQDCERVTDQLVREVSDLRRVKDYLDTLEKPLAAASGAIAVDLPAAFHQVQESVRADPGGTSKIDAFDVMSKMFKLGSIVPGVGGVFSGISSAIEVAAYFIRPNNSPNLLGPRLTEKVDKLAEDMFNRYAAAATEFRTIGKVVVSDYGKLTTMASKVASDPAWSLEGLDRAVELMRDAARQFFLQSLLPVAYPFVIQINPAPPAGPATANNYNCFSSLRRLGSQPASSETHPFQNEPPGGQDRQIVAFGADGASIAPVFALSGSTPVHIPPYPVPSASLTESLFRPVDTGGYGFTKPELYSPRYFDFTYTGDRALKNGARCPTGRPLAR